MSSSAKFQNSSFVRLIVSSKNEKGIFLSVDLLLDDLSKILFCRNQVNHVTSLCVDFHDRRPNILGKEESQRNHRNELMRVELTTLAPLN